VVGSVIAVAAVTDVRLALALVVIALGNVLVGLWRTGRGLRKALSRGST
jgi:hypothetical protein